MLEDEKQFLGQPTTPVPPAVNWHCEAFCNYGCKFCYARFTSEREALRLTENEGLSILRSLAEAGVQKVNFVGGEPMLHPHIKSWIIETKRLGMVTSIVSNGSRMDDEWLHSMRPHLDWIGLSIDASNDQLHTEMGRGRKGELKQGESQHLKRCEGLILDIKKYGFGFKLNTVVSSVNMRDDMSSLLLRWKPDRWKIFQALPIEGENEHEMESLQISNTDFEAYVLRHKQALSNQLQIAVVAEDNDAMKGTYAMINPLGFVYTNAEGRYKYSTKTIMDIGFANAWQEVSGGWTHQEFVNRGGEWNWSAPVKDEGMNGVEG